MRPVCPRCERPTSTCLCPSLPLPVDTRLGLLILQHPAEAGHAKNTTALLTLGLSRAVRLRGERFDAALARPGDVLLYPGHQADNADNADEADEAAAPRAVAGLQPAVADARRLILLDGNWRQSRRLLATHPWLGALPRWSLPQQPSRYAIRRAHRPGQLSTFEAGLHALALLEGDGERFAPLWAAFEAFVQAGLARRGQSGLT